MRQALLRARRRPTASGRRRRGRSRSAGGEWVSLHTPGHTDDHLCLFDPAERRAALGRPRAAHDHAAHLRPRTPAPTRCTEFFDVARRRCATSRASRSCCPPTATVHDLAGRVEGIRGHHEERLDTLRDGVDASSARPRSRSSSQRLFRAALVGPDGRERDLRPPRAPAPARARPSAAQRTASCSTTPWAEPARHRPAPRARRRADDHPHSNPSSLSHVGSARRAPGSITTRSSTSASTADARSRRRDSSSSTLPSRRRCSRGRARRSR